MARVAQLSKRRRSDVVDSFNQSYGKERIITIHNTQDIQDFSGKITIPLLEKFLIVKSQHEVSSNFKGQGLKDLDEACLVNTKDRGIFESNLREYSFDRNC